MSRPPVVDCVLHPAFRRSSDIRQYLPQPWKSRPFPDVQRYVFPAPVGQPPNGEWRPHGQRPTEQAGSDPALMREHLDTIGADRAVLLPLTRGILPDVDLGQAICRATNDWLSETWLGEWNVDGRFLGSIRVDPRDPGGAIAEVERWSADPRMVQVAVPLEAHQPYGKRAYSPLWECLDALDVPVTVRSDGGSGCDFWPTPNGYPHEFAEYASLFPLNYIYHLTSLIAEGAFERFPKLRVLFADGGHDLLTPLMWRMDMDWASAKSETPWQSRLPTEYLAAHVRFVTSKLEGPTDSSLGNAWLRRTDAERLLMYGSRYPHWTGMDPDETPGPADALEPILSGNAASFYRLELPVPAA